MVAMPLCPASRNNNHPLRLEYQTPQCQGARDDDQFRRHLSSVLKHKLNGTKKLDTQKSGPCNGDHRSQNDSGNCQNGVPKHAKHLLSVLKSRISPIDCGNFRLLGRYVLTQRRKADCLVLTVDAIVVVPRERGAEASQPHKLRALEPALAWLTCAGAGSHLHATEGFPFDEGAPSSRNVVLRHFYHCARVAVCARLENAVPPVAPGNGKTGAPGRLRTPGAHSFLGDFFAKRWTLTSYCRIPLHHSWQST